MDDKQDKQEITKANIDDAQAKKEIEIVAPENLLTGVFSDLIITHSSPESVSLTFLQKLPLINKKEDAEQTNNTIVARVSLSWPHFFRLVKVLNDTVINNKDRVVKHLEQTIEWTGVLANDEDE